MSVIEVKGITKDYCNHQGVFDVNFTVEKGEVLGFLGPNGAGKTTTIRQLMGFIKPDQGTEMCIRDRHIPEEDYSQLDKKLPQFILLCQDLELKIVPDVSPVTFEKLNLKLGDFSALKQMGIQALRLDYGFDDIENIKQLSKDFEIILNASVVNESLLIEAETVSYTHLI